VRVDGRKEETKLGYLASLFGQLKKDDFEALYFIQTTYKKLQFTTYSFHSPPSSNNALSLEPLITKNHRIHLPTHMHALVFVSYG